MPDLTVKFKGRCLFGHRADETVVYVVYIPSHPDGATQSSTVPEYQPFERRSLWYSLKRRSDSRPLLTHWEMNPTSTGFELEKELPDGDYTVGIFYTEARRFGPILIGRKAGTIVPFTIRSAQAD